MKTFETIFVCIGVSVVAFFAGRGTVTKIAPDIAYVDTVTVFDTLRIDAPVPVKDDIARIEYVRLPALRDTVWFTQRVDSLIRDTVYVPIEISRREYRDSAYFAVVEGYKAALTYIEVYPKTTYIYKGMVERVKPRWGVGIQAGVGTDFERIRPFVGVGIQYNLITW